MPDVNDSIAYTGQKLTNYLQPIKQQRNENFYQESGLQVCFNRYFYCYCIPGSNMPYYYPCKRSRFIVMETKVSLLDLRLSFARSYPYRKLCFMPNDRELFSDLAFIRGYDRQTADMFVLCFSLCLN